MEYDISKHDEGDIYSLLTHIPIIYLVKNYFNMILNRDYNKGYRSVVR